MVDTPAPGTPVPAAATVATAPMPTKPWHLSMTIISAGLATIAQIVQTVTPIIDSNFGTHLTTDPHVTAFITIVGTVLAIVGRLKATTVIAG